MDNFYSGKSITLRTNPFSFIQRDAGIMFGVNYRWHQRWSATLDPKFIFYSVQTPANSTGPRKPLGVRVKTDIRYHIRNVFIAPEFVFGYTSTKTTTEFGVNCVGGNCAYYTLQEYTEIKKEAGGAIKFGLTGPIRKNNENWKLELYTGIGVSFFDFQEKGIPPGGSFVMPPTHGDGLGSLSEDEPNIMIPFGLIISYRIK
jgi:hypothetical protein